jgi:hypothetical protein
MKIDSVPKPKHMAWVSGAVLAVGSMLGRPRGIPLQRLSAHLLRAMPSWGLGSLSLAVQKVISQNES